jgi:UDP-N-acetylmuramoyl-L-alanyl-D-glutamate--2,6-diaminopimelate ligase
VLPSIKKNGITYVQVENSAAAAAYMAHNFFEQPSEKMKLVE